MTVRASIEVAERVFTGVPFPVAVLLETTSSRITQGVVVLLRGFTSLRSRGDADKNLYRPFGSWRVLVAASGDLGPGVHRFDACLLLPEDAPPSGSGIMEIYYELDARVKLEFPWMFDAVATRRLTVARPVRRERLPPHPFAISSVARRDDGLFIELSLDDTSFAPGESIDGSFSVENIGQERVASARVGLVPLVPGVVGGGKVASPRSVAIAGEGGAVHFSIPLPKAAALSFASHTLGVEQAIVLRVAGSSVECRIPVLIDNFAPRICDVAKAMSAGRARWRRGWADEGERAGLTLTEGELALQGRLASADVRVWPCGNRIRAKLAWDTLGIGLSVRPRGRLARGVSFEQIDPAFGKRFIARGHSQGQVLAALGEDLRRALLGCEEAELGDTGAAVASTVLACDPEGLRGFLVVLDALAHAVVAAERRLPTPAWVIPAAAAAWRAFAADTNGRLRAGRMAVTGAIVDGECLDVETRSDTHGRPELTRLTLSVDTQPTDPEADRAPTFGERADADLRRSVKGRDRAPRISIRPHAVVLELAGSTPDPAALLVPLAEMARLARRLRGELTRGPYR